MKFYILDAREVWHAAAIEAAKKRGMDAVRIFHGHEVEGGGIGFLRPHAEPKGLKQNRDDYVLMADRLTMIQDLDQVMVYEDKSAQFMRWNRFMPPTWRFEREADAKAFIKTARYPLVSKADVGASSVNVRILKDQRQAGEHIVSLFRRGIQVNHGEGNARSYQKGYALLQEFIPHTVTWRVNAVGNARAIFRRFNYRDRPVAQTGNVEPVMEMSEEVESLLAFANTVFAEIETKWCALDILRSGDGWRLLETSLAWPWPSPGRCNEAPFFGTGRRWIEMFDVMFDQYEAGAWSE